MAVSGWSSATWLLGWILTSGLTRFAIRTALIDARDPRYVAAARELRDRYLEAVEMRPELLESARGGAEGKYEVGRLMGGAISAPPAVVDAEPMRLLAA